jgi:hypothetical protein
MIVVSLIHTGGRTVGYQLHTRQTNKAVLQNEQ